MISVPKLAHETSYVSYPQESRKKAQSGLVLVVFDMGVGIAEADLAQQSLPFQT
jgi:hypothetical protein